ncbi:hypothetical protein V6N13_053740 [Hibiscus sabdariffa]|uniref:Uncharacterized protein n=1 Tax=Hibiscus sabdariffa TaxID=183260 RepID=A0ABR2T6N1_9ROSI
MSHVRNSKFELEHVACFIHCSDLEPMVADTWYDKIFCRWCSQLIPGRMWRSFSKGIVNIRIPHPPLGVVYAEVLATYIAPDFLKQLIWDFLGP